jgi:hypothetical protein
MSSRMWSPSAVFTQMAPSVCKACSLLIGPPRLKNDLLGKQDDARVQLDGGVDPSAASSVHATVVPANNVPADVAQTLERSALH